MKSNDEEFLSIPGIYKHNYRKQKDIAAIGYRLF
jgi:hypothetical protein